jgi:flavodoxin
MKPEAEKMKSMIVVYSYHHNNTRKVAEAMAAVIGAGIKSPAETDGNALQGYGLTGFGAGIDSGRHYRELLDFAGTLPPMEGKRCFIFSTSAVQGDKKVSKDHARLREILQSKGYDVIGEFSCKGYNTNSFLRHIGGMNKGRPNEADIRDAMRFSSTLETGMN